MHVNDRFCRGALARHLRHSGVESWNPYGTPQASPTPIAESPLTGEVNAAIVQEILKTQRWASLFVVGGALAFALITAFAVRTLTQSVGIALTAVAMAGASAVPTILLGRWIYVANNVTRTPSVVSLAIVTRSLLAFWQATAVFFGTAVGLAIVVRFGLGAFMRA